MPALLLGALALCFFEFGLHRHFALIREFEIAFLSRPMTALSGLAVWLGVLIFLSPRTHNCWLAGFLLSVAVWFFFSADSASDVLRLVCSVTLGKATALLLESGRRKSDIEYYLVGVILLLAISSCWHLDMADNFYHGSRWMGLWDNPNTDGMLMGAGILLAAGLLTQNKTAEDWLKRLMRIFLFVASAMMLVGLIMSYSRGAWVGMGIGLSYLASCYGKLKWRYVLPCMIVFAVVAFCFWGRTLDSAPWYVKRADLGRPSAQHRASAWWAGLEIMRDHPFGVGWNNTVSLYEKNYSPPEGGAAAIATNDYMMIGTELGVPALICFVGYAALCLRGKPKIEAEEGRITAACRAGAIVLLVAFWFDGGLFSLPTGALFWVLLEVGSDGACGANGRAIRGTVKVVNRQV